MTGTEIFFFVLFFVVYPLAYFFLAKPFDRYFTTKGSETIERGIPYISQLFRVNTYAWGIVAEIYRNRNIQVAVLAKLVSGILDYQNRVYGKVNFRKEANRFQIVLAYFISYGIIFVPILTMLYIFHDFVLFREFAKAR